MRYQPLLILSTTLLLWHCSDRERLNPLDPMSAGTGGKPTSLGLLSTKNLVSLEWDEMNNNSIIGYNVWRKAEGATEFSLLHITDTKIPQATDTVTTYDVRYTYEVSTLTSSWESPRSTPESIITGPFNYWIADYFDISLSRLSYDGSHMLL